jgi:hypothetical protein
MLIPTQSSECRNTRNFIECIQGGGKTFSQYDSPLSLLKFGLKYKEILLLHDFQYENLA